MNLEFLRKSKGYTLQDVQKITGIHYSVLSLIEHGHREPTRDHQIKLYRLFGNALELELEGTVTFSGVPDMPEVLYKDEKPLVNEADEEEQEEAARPKARLFEDEDIDDNTETAWAENFEANLEADVIYRLPDALRKRYPGKGYIVVGHDDDVMIFVTEASALYSLPYSISGETVSLSDERPEPVLEKKRALNSAIRKARMRGGQSVPDPWAK